MSTENRVILVPLDFSEQSLIALSQSYNLAKLTKSDLRLVHIIDQDFISGLAETILSKYNYEDQLRDDIQKKLEELSVKVKKEQGINTSINIRTGKIYHEIVEESNDIKASMIIMGTTGASTLKKKFLGSNAARVIKEALCPVITIKGHEHRPGCRHIVLPLDLTKETREKVDKCIELAKLFGSTIHIVSVLETDDEFIINKLTRQLEQVKSVVESFDVSYTGELIQANDVPLGIIEYAKKVNADLIVIMTQNESNITDLFIASAAQEVINNSDIPVLCLRPTVKSSIVEFVTS